MGLKRFKSQASLAKPILSFLIRLILLSCVFITTWQAWNCVVKYQENPQSTSSSMEYIGNLPLPQITICSRLIDNRQNRLKDVPFNLTKLTSENYLLIIDRHGIIRKSIKPVFLSIIRYNTV